MKVYHERVSYISDCSKYIVLSQEEGQNNVVLGLTLNHMLIMVDSSNRRIKEFPCPAEILDVYKKRLKEAKNIPDYQLCLFFGTQETGTKF